MLAVNSSYVFTMYSYNSEGDLTGDFAEHSCQDHLQSLIFILIFYFRLFIYIIPFIYLDCNRVTKRHTVSKNYLSAEIFTLNMQLCNIEKVHTVLTYKTYIYIECIITCIMTGTLLLVSFH